MIERDNASRLARGASGAIGDVAGPPQLAHVVSAAAVEFMAGKNVPASTAARSPAVFTAIPVASVGMSEEQAREEGLEINGRVSRCGVRVPRRETEGFVKPVFGSRYGELLGGVVVGAEAAELVGELALGLRLEATYEELLHTIHAHPTMAEGIMEAAGEAFGEAINI